MATHPLFPTAAPAPLVFNTDDYDDDDSSESGDIYIPTFNVGDFYDDSEEESDEYSDESDVDIGVRSPISAYGGLAELLNLRKKTTEFPMPTKGFAAQPFIPTTRPVVPLPPSQVTMQQQPTGGLRLTVLPTTPALTLAPVAPTIPQMQTTIPQMQTTIPQMPTAIPQMQTTIPQMPTAIPQMQTTIPQMQTTIPQMNIPQMPTAIPQMNIPQMPTAIPQMTIPQMPTAIPQMTIPQMPTAIQQKPVTTPQIPSIQGIPQTTVPQTTGPLVPQLQGLTFTPQPGQTTAPNLVGKDMEKVVDIAAILEKMPGISVASITAPPSQVPADINDLIKAEDNEDPDDFEARRRLTIKLASIPDYKLNNMTAVVAGLIMMKKAKLGITYDHDVEAAISYLTALLQRQ